MSEARMLKKLLTLILVSFFVQIDTSFADLQIGGKAGLVSGGVRTVTLSPLDSASYYYFERGSRWGSVSPDDTNIQLFSYYTSNYNLVREYRNLAEVQIQNSFLSGKTVSKFIVNDTKFDVTLTPHVNITIIRTTGSVTSVVTDPTSITYNIEFTDGTSLYGKELYQPKHLFLSTKPVQKLYLGKGTGQTPKLIWQNTDPPTITAFSVAPTSIDLDTRPTGNVTLSWTATAQNEVRTSRVYLEPQATRIGQTYVTAANTGISETITTPQPTQNQTYRLVISNPGGASHRDVNVTVQKDLAITNFRRTGYAQVPTNPLRADYRFAFRITGYPKPNSFVFSGVHSFTTDDRHLTAVSGMENTWDFEITFTLGVVTSGALTVVATNGTTGTGSSASATITNVAN